MIIASLNTESSFRLQLDQHKSFNFFHSVVFCSYHHHEILLSKLNIKFSNTWEINIVEVFYSMTYTQSQNKTTQCFNLNTK